jgi:hypothetical protein
VLRVARFALVASGSCWAGCTRDFDSLFEGAADSAAAGAGGIAGAGGGTTHDSGSDAPPDVVGAGSAYADLVRSHGPIAYFRLGESSGTVAVDEIGDHPGSYEGNVGHGQPGAIAGDPDTCVRFDQKDARMLVPDVASFFDFAALHPFTLEAWVKRDASAPVTADGRYHFVSKYDNGLPTESQIGFGLQLKSEGDPPSWSFVFLRKQGLDGEFINTPTPDPNAWHYIAGVFDGSELRLHIDDQAPELHGTAVSIDDTTLPLVIGNSFAGSTWFGGLVDEVAIYDRALTQAEIDEHFAKGTGAD